MKTKRHTIEGASLRKIEELDHLGTPDWVPFTVAIPGTETSALDEVMVETQHFSGVLRGCSRCDFVDDGINLPDEDGTLHDLGELLDNAAERLDQAHQEWLEARHHAVRHQEPKPVMRHKGGTAEHSINPESIEIPDLWHLAMRLRDAGDTQACDQILDVWQLAHDLKIHAIEEATE